MSRTSCGSASARHLKSIAGNCTDAFLYKGDMESPERLARDSQKPSRNWRSLPLLTETCFTDPHVRALHGNEVLAEASAC